MVCLVVGLGNPGRRYRGTRHNVGFMVVEALNERLGDGRWQRRGGTLVSRVGVSEVGVLLAKPQTFMNNSGLAVVELVRSQGIGPQELVVVHDDLDLSLGRIRLRPRGSAGGHRGVASVLTSLGTQDVGRVKVGIGRPPAGVNPVDYVLRVPPREEREVLGPALQRAVEALEFLLRGGSWDQAMNRFNQEQEHGFLDDGRSPKI